MEDRSKQSRRIVARRRPGAWLEGGALGLVALLFSGLAEAHLCGPNALTVVQGKTATWTITADLSEELSLYTPLSSVNPAVATVSPNAPFMARDGEFTFAGVAVGTTSFAARWLYEPTGASGICSVIVTVVPEDGVLCVPPLVALNQGQIRVVQVRVFEDGMEVNRPVAASFAADTIEVSPDMATSPAQFTVRCIIPDAASTSILFSAGTSGSCSTIVLCNGAPAPTPSPTPRPTTTPTASPSPRPTATAPATATPTPTPTPTATPTPTLSATPTPTASATVDPTPTPTPISEPTPDVASIDIHPIQVVQDPPGRELEETIELVAKKATMVRVFVHIDEPAGTRIGPVTGTLKVGGLEQQIRANLDIVTLTGVGKVTQVIPIGDPVRDAGDKFFDEQLAFNFFTGAKALEPIAGEQSMDFTLSLPRGASVAASESFELKTSFQGLQYDIHYVFLEVFGFTGDFLFRAPVPDGYKDDLERFFEHFVAVYPLARSQTRWSYDRRTYRISDWSTLALWLFAASIDSPGRASVIDRFVIMVPGAEAGRETGLLQEEVGGAGGYTPYTISETVFLQVRSSVFNLAHELGHTYRLGTPSLNIGLLHNTEPADAGWDVREVTGARRLKPEMGGGQFRALMFPEGNSSGKGWITYQEYNELLDQFLDNRGASAEATRSLASARPLGSVDLGVSAADTDDVLVVSGTIFASGEHVLFPFFQSTGGATASGPPGSGAYTLAIVSASGDEVSRVELNPVFAELGQSGDIASPFLARLPFRSDAERIELRERGRLLETRLVSAAAPSVSIVDLAQVGASLLEVEIDASDADGDPLDYAVSYTPDGERFVDAHVEWLEAGRRFQFDASSLPGSAAGRVRVLATDGVRSSVALSEPFAVDNQAPLVFIQAPIDGAVFGDAQTLVLQGSANDLEEGALSGDALVWESDLAGVLGQGSSLEVSASTLGVGNHRITLTATDSSGASASESISIAVRLNPDPDAMPDGIGSIPSSLAPGDPAMLEASITNFGPPARGMISFFEGDPDRGGTLIARSEEFLPENGRSVVTAPWTPAAMGTVTVFVRVTDVVSLGPIEVPETITDNNQASATIEVGAPGTLSVSPAALDFGAELTLLNLLLKNQGDGPLTWSIEESGDDRGAVLLSVQGGASPSGVDTNTLPGRGSAVVTVLVDRPGFDDETHVATLTISSSAEQIEIPIVYRDARATPRIDHFMLYGVKTTPKAPRFVKFGPVHLADELGAADYDVARPLGLGLPADKNGEGVIDGTVHLEEYQLNPAKGTPKFSKRADVHVVSQCSDLLLEVKQPVSLLVPTGKNPSGSAEKPDPAMHMVDHFLCYAAAAQKKKADGTKLPGLAKGIQVEVEDQFQARRYDLAKVSKLCIPTEKSGSPVLLAGREKGQAKPIEPATIDRPADHLLCYRATLAQKRIEQDGCGPLVPGDKGVKIVPNQARHAQRTGLFVANQFGEERLDTVKPVELCVPSRTTLPAP